MKHRRGRRHGARGQSLAEVVVVMAIVAVAGMALLAVLSKVINKKGKGTVAVLTGKTAAPAEASFSVQSHGAEVELQPLSYEVDAGIATRSLRSGGKGGALSTRSESARDRSSQGRLYTRSSEGAASGSAGVEMAGAKKAAAAGSSGVRDTPLRRVAGLFVRAVATAVVTGLLWVAFIGACFGSIGRANGLAWTKSWSGWGWMKQGTRGIFTRG